MQSQAQKRRTREFICKPVVVLCLLIKWFIPPAAFSKCNLIVYAINYACSCSIFIRWIFKKSEWASKWVEWTSESVSEVCMMEISSTERVYIVRRKSKNCAMRRRAFLVRGQGTICVCLGVVEMWFHAIRFWWHPWLYKHSTATQHSKCTLCWKWHSAIACVKSATDCLLWFTSI